jgi:hypothetical protein
MEKPLDQKGLPVSQNINHNQSLSPMVKEKGNPK